MKSYQNSTFQDRLEQVAKAKQRALDQLRERPPADPAVVQARQEAARKKEEAAAAKREARKAAEQSDREAAAEAEAARIAAIKPEKTEEERKLARDERYAARKARR